MRIIAAPVVLVMLLGFATQLEALANDSSEKTISYADDMNAAMECAAKGIPISECSPNLMNYDFSGERDELQGIIDDMETELTGITIVDEDNSSINMTVPVYGDTY